MKKIDANTKIEDVELVDYPYIGIGRKTKRNVASDDELEKIIGG